jgi:hypothetical protein
MDRKIRLFNPWWEENRIPPELYSENYFKDYSLIENLLNEKKVITILGARQSGKTYLLYYIIDYLFKKNIPPSRILFLSLDDSIINIETAISYYERIILKKNILGSDEKFYIFLDEIQLLDNWQEIIKHYLDELYPLTFILASSSINYFRKKSLELVEKDYGEIRIFPMNFHEYLTLKKSNIAIPNFSLMDLYNFQFIIDKKVEMYKYIHELDNFMRDFITQGGYYRYIKETNPLIRTQKIISQVVDMAIYKDISTIYDIGNPRKIEDILLYIARNLCSIFQFDYLNKLFGLSFPILDNYLNYLESSFLIYSSYNFGIDNNKVQFSPRKIYFSDSGIRNSIVGETSINLKDINSSVDNAIYLHLKKLKNKYNFDIFFWRKDTFVIDILILFNKQLKPIEINYKSKQLKSQERNLLRFFEEFDCNRGIIISKDIIDLIKIGDREILIVPAALFLLSN